MSSGRDLGVIVTRRSSRKFSSDPVDDGDLEQIIQAGLLAPSSKNSQPWFIAVARGASKESICEWVEGNPRKLPTKPGPLLIDEPEAKPRDSTFQTLRYVRAAPVLLLIFNRAPFSGGRKQVETAIRDGKNASYENEYVGIGACMENMLLAANALDLGAIAVMDILPAAPLIAETFQIDYDLVVGIVVGHAESPREPRHMSADRLVRYLD